MLSSFFSVKTATAWLTMADCPSLTRILRSHPSSNTLCSTVALSVATSKITSPLLTKSPSFLHHLAIIPSSIVGESLGIVKVKGMLELHFLRKHLFNRDHNALFRRHGFTLKHFGIRHRRLALRYPHNRSVEKIKAMLGDLKAHLSADPSKNMALFYKDAKMGLAHRASYCSDIQWFYGPKVDQFNLNPFFTKFFGRQLA